MLVTRASYEPNFKNRYGLRARYLFSRPPRCTRLILLAISSLARRRLPRFLGARLTRDDLAPYPSSMPRHGHFWRRPAVISPSQPVMPAQAKRAVAQRAPKSR